MPKRKTGGSLWADYGLSLTLTAMFLASWLAQGVSQWVEAAQNAEQHGQAVSAGQFLPEFLAATFENWQSEFLQLLTFVVLTAHLVHRGSPESKDSDEEVKGSLERIERLLKEGRKTA